MQRDCDRLPDAMRRMIVIVIVIGIGFVMFRVGLTVFMRFEHHMHVRIKKENQIRSQSHHAAQSQPNRFVFSRSHNKSSAQRASSSWHTLLAQACFMGRASIQAFFHPVDKFSSNALATAFWGARIEMPAQRLTINRGETE
jgi:hypothetical protein